MVAAIAGICVMTGCSKEQVTNNASDFQNNSKNASVIANENNPYDYCGIIHNEILDYIIEKNPHPSQEEIFNLSKEYMQLYYDYSGEIPFEEDYHNFNSTTNFIVDAFLNHRSFKDLIESESIYRTFDMLVEYTHSIVESNHLPAPEEYASFLIEQENKLVNDRETAGISPNEISEYDVALGSLAIARYSYYYWYNVANDPKNAWNHIKIKTKKQDGDDPERGFWGKLWDGVCDFVVGAVEVVCQVAVTPLADTCGFVVGGFSGINSGNGYMLGVFDAVDGIKSAGSYSGSVWNWDDWYEPYK